MIAGEWRQRITDWGASLIAVLLTFQFSLVYGLNSDSWYFLAYPERLVEQHSRTARPLLAGIQWLINQTGFNMVRGQLWDGLFGIAVLAAAMVLLQEALLRIPSVAPGGKVLAFFISYAVVCNPFMSEWFGNSFIIPATCVSELLCVAAGILLAQRRFGPKEIAAVIGMAVIASCLFQSPLSMIAPIGLALLAPTDTPLRTIAWRTAVGLAAWVAGGASGYLYSRFIHPYFSSNIDHRIAMFQPLTNIGKVWAYQNEIWLNSFLLIPRGWFVGVLIAVVILMVSFRVARRAKLLAAAAGALAITLTIGIHVITGVVWIVPRSVTGLFAAIGLVAVPALLAGRRTRDAALATAMLVLWFGVSAVSTNRALGDDQTNYRLDLFEAKLMYEQIAKYEETTGTRVNNVAFHLDKYPQWCYERIRCSGDFNVRAWTKSIPREPMLRTVSGRMFKEIPFTQSLASIFGKDNWNEFSPEQVKCVGDTAYIAIY